MSCPKLTLLFGQPSELSTSFQSRQLGLALEEWFQVRRLEIHRVSQNRAITNFQRFVMNYVRHRIWKPAGEFVLYGNDGVADLRRWRSPRRKTILYWYDCPENWVVTPPPQNSFDQWLRYQNVIHSDYVFAVSHMQVELASRLRGHSSGVAYLPVGVNTAVFDPGLFRPPDLRERLRIPPKPVVGYLGYLGFFAGKFAGQVLFDAVPSILRRHDVHFLIVGFGPALELWKTEVARAGLADRFTFTGFVDDTMIPNLIALIDVAIDTLEPGFHSLARSETKLKQYMAMARACVATDIGENRIDLDHGNCGLLAEPGPDALADAVVRLCRDEALRTSLGKKARARAVSVYDWKVLARQLAQKVLAV